MKRGILICLATLTLLALLIIPAALTGPGPAYAGPGGPQAIATTTGQPAFSGSVILYVGSPEALVNDKAARIDENPAVVPFIENSRTLMPLAFVAKTLGFSVEWHEASRTVTLKQAGLTLEFALASKIMKNNGKPIEMETAAIARNGRTLVPISYVAKAMNINVTYDRGLIILDSEKTYSLSADKEYIDSLIAKLSGLPVVGSAENFNTLMKDLAAEQSQYRNMGGDLAVAFAEEAMPVPEAVADAAPEAPTAQPAIGAGEADHSSTNVQVAGVDEADIIKTDGQFVYHLSGGTLNIIQASGRGEMKQVCALDLEYQNDGFYPQDIYVDGGRLCVIGESYTYLPPQVLEDDVNINRHYSENSAKVLVYDISQKTAPKLTRQFSAEGSLLSSRKVDNMLYLMVNYNLYFYGLPEPCQAVPYYQDSASAAGGASLQADFSSMRYFPGNEDDSMLLVCGLDITDDQAEAQVASLLGYGGTVYMSRSALYVSKYNYTYNIMPLASGVNVEVNDRTTFFKFALDNGYAIYQGKGQADGTVLNQYSMDEFDGCFRAAMTVNSYRGASTNSLVIFDQTMQKIGSVDDLAPGERIYAARFMGGRAFMVTYRTVDPLFALDLSDPYNPKVLGELKIPGYSTYLHPYDENHLIGFGRDTEELTTIDSKGQVVDVRAVNRGLKLALFDISDLSNPKEVAVVSIGDESTHSELLYNPKTLLFSKEKGFIAFPVQQYSYYGEKDAKALSGAHIYDISPSGIKLRGIITHAAMDAKTHAYGVGVEIQRILYIGDTFYSASGLGLQANNINSLQYLGSVKYGN